MYTTVLCEHVILLTKQVFVLQTLNREVSYGSDDGADPTEYFYYPGRVSV
jgi:hypothetical protein